MLPVRVICSSFQIVASSRANMYNIQEREVRKLNFSLKTDIKKKKRKIEILK
jgi:hypothetical protein